MILGKIRGLISQAIGSAPFEWRWWTEQGWLWLSLGTLSAVALLFLTRSGPGASGDSVYYLMGARGLLEGVGYSRWSGSGAIVPITAFPPLFSGLLAGLAWLGIDLFQTGRVLNALLLGASVAMTGRLLYRYSNSLFLAFLGSGLVLTAENVLLTHAWVMADALFLFLSLIILDRLLVYLRRGSRSALLVLSTLIGLSTLVRYVGLVWVPISGTALLLLGEGQIGRRIRSAVLLAVLGVLPFMAWSYRNFVIAGNATNRSVTFHPITADSVKDFFLESSAWFFPGGTDLRLRYRSLPLLGLVVIPAGYAVSKLRRPGRSWSDPDEGSQLPWAAMLFLTGYVGAIVVSISFLDANMSFSRRYMMPVYVFSVLLTSSTAFHLIRRFRRRAVALAGAGIGLGLAGMLGWNAVRLMVDPGWVFGYTDRLTQWPDAVRVFRSLDPSTSVITNEAEYFYLVTNRPAYTLPIRFDGYTNRPRDDISSQVMAMRQRLRNGAVLILFFTLEEHSTDFPAREDLVLGLCSARDFGYFSEYIDPNSIRSDGLVCAPIGPVGKTAGLN